MYRPCLHCESKKYNAIECPLICNYGYDKKCLAEYENTNLTPAEIETLKVENAELKERLGKVEMPFIAMIEQQLDNNGNFDKSRKEQEKNGRYAVVYLDEKKWKIPLIDICSRQNYNKKACQNRLKELEEENL